ncbi:MAG: hypothetical protein AAGA66_01555 [Bacteroidota bacterium]
MSDLEDRVRLLVEDIIKSEESIFLVDVKVKGNVENQKVLVFLDGDNGVNIDHCGKVSRSLGKIMEDQDIMPGKYFLEVSSPGLDHPIKLKRQYAKNAGRQLEVEKADGEKVTGKMLEIHEDAIVLNIKNEKRNIPFSEIIQSKILVSFK